MHRPRVHHAIAWLLLAASVAAAGELTPVNQRSYRPYPPVELTSYIFEAPRPIRAWTVQIDLTSPDIEFAATCGSDDLEGRLETRCATTQQFAEDNNVQVAVNAAPFAPLRDKPGEGMDVVGLGVCNGHMYSEPNDQYGALVVTRDGRVDIWAPPYGDRPLDDVEEAVGGFHILVAQGKNVAARAAATTTANFADVNPRTAAGLSPDRHTLWLIVVDGRNTERSRYDPRRTRRLRHLPGLRRAAQPRRRRIEHPRGRGSRQSRVARRQPTGRPRTARHAPPGGQQFRRAHQVRVGAGIAPVTRKSML